MSKKLAHLTTAPALRASPVFGYVRKSTESADRQVASLDRQKDAISDFVARKGWGSVDAWFSDEQSGKNFDRPGFQALAAACQRHRQYGKPGKVVCLDYDRFARPVDKNFAVSLWEYRRAELALHDCGFELDYVLTPKTGNVLQDEMMGAMKPVQSGDYLSKLSPNVRKGKRDLGAKGMWNGGPPPFPAARYDARSGRLLERGQRAPNGMSVLGPGTPEALQAWIDGATALVQGATLDTVARMFAARGVPNYYGGDWRHANILKIYTNRALIGEVTYAFTNDDGTTDTHTGKAAWDALVPVALFQRVNDVLDERRARGRRRPASSEYLLTLTCKHCGTTYVAATSRKGGAEQRFYTHPTPIGKMNKLQAKRAEKAQCKHWYLDADDLESKVFDLIVRERASKEFVRHFKRAMKESGDIDLATERAERDAKQLVQTLTKERDNLAAKLAQVDDDAETSTYLLGVIREKTKKLEAARLAVQRVRNDHAAKVAVSDKLVAMVMEAKNLVEAWQSPKKPDQRLERRRAIIGMWVDHVVVTVEREPGRERRNKRYAEVFLNMRPEPVELALSHSPESSSEPSGQWGRDAERFVV